MPQDLPPPVTRILHGAREQSPPTRPDPVLDPTALAQDQLPNAETQEVDELQRTQRTDVTWTLAPLLSGDVKSGHPHRLIPGLLEVRDEKFERHRFTG